MVYWFDRVFDFSARENLLPNIIERLDGTPIRLVHKIGDTERAVLIARNDESWSIQEHIGHLIDLEPLWQGRLDDILEGRDMLRAADLTNRKTYEANHNEESIDTLLDQFQAVRNTTVTRLRGLSHKDVLLTSQHPRLKTPMRTMDLFLFAAEHDDHHLAIISRLLRKKNAHEPRCLI